jgi:5-methyltetrahydrofolate--homocysteine methyltransferase
MNQLQKLLASEPYIMLDGAMGTMLMATGLEQGDPPEMWNTLYPERIRAVHRAYVQAGARVILTNSFGGTRFRLKLHNWQDRVAELNRAAAAQARAAADEAAHLVVVAGSMGPTGELLEPMGNMTLAEAEAAFAEQAAALAEGGADALWIETMSDLNEVRAAIAGAGAVCQLPICATMTFDTRGRTMMGVTPAQAVEALRPLQLAAIGANCGNGPAEIEGVIEAMHAFDPDVTLIAKSNAGIPQWLNNTLVYDGTPEVMARYAQRVRALGARLIGGCCGNTPAHIEAMVAALQSSEPLEPTMARQSAPTVESNGSINGSDAEVITNDANGARPQRLRRRQRGS